MGFFDIVLKKTSPGSDFHSCRRNKSDPYFYFVKKISSPPLIESSLIRAIANLCTIIREAEMLGDEVIYY
jgi:hypothetical protein